MHYVNKRGIRLIYRTDDSRHILYPVIYCGVPQNRELTLESIEIFIKESENASHLVHREVWYRRLVQRIIITFDYVQFTLETDLNRV